MFALEMLVYLEGIERTKDLQERLKLSVLASGSRTVQDLWPEWFPKKAIADEKEEVDQEDLDNVVWESPASGGDFDEMMRLQQELANSAVSLTYDESAGEWQ